MDTEAPAPFTQAFFDRNLKALARINASLAGRMAVHRPLTTLVGDAENCDIEFRGTRVYGGTVRNFLDDLERTAYVPSLRLALNPPQTGTLCEDSNDFMVNAVRRATEEGITFQLHPTVPTAGNVILLGLGLGMHVRTLVERTNCANLLIAEPNVDFIYHSLFTMDWAWLVDRFSRDNRLLTLFHHTTGESLGRELRMHLRVASSPFIDGTSVFQGYASSVFTETVRNLKADAHLALMGLGFLLDEFDMVRNSHRNLREGGVRLFRRGTGRLPLPCFVMAAGPSIDNDIENIRANADKALVITCGTGLRVALHAGITPDIHVELENVPLLADLHGRLAEKFDLSSIILVATTTVDPRVARFYKRVAYFFRPGLASYTAFCPGEQHSIRHCGPMVSNLGLAVACELGAREIYLFGMDLGARDPERHHAKDAPYNSGEVAFDGSIINLPVPANFGGTCLSEKIYLWSRDAITEGIRSCWLQGYSYFNCSDGVRIDATLPRKSATVRLKPVEDKAAVVERLFDSFPPYEKSDFEASWDSCAMHGRVDELLDRVGALMAEERVRPDESDEGWMLAVTAVVRTLVPLDNRITTEMFELRGSILLLLIALCYYNFRVTQEEQRGRFRQIIREEVIAYLEHLRDRVHRFYDFIEAWDGETPDKEFTPDLWKLVHGS